MSILNKVFWAAAAIEALFFVVMFLITANTSAHSDGGKEMSLFFFIFLPFLVLTVLSLIYWKTDSPTLHVILLIAILIPAVLLAGQRMRSTMWAGDAAAGSWIYQDPKMGAFVAAVSALNEKKVRELAPQVDVNQAGESGWTPLKWAVMNVVETGNKLQPTAPGVSMIRLLLSLGAKPDTALPTACTSNTGEVTGVLLDAGANPNYKEEDGTPAFFSCLKYARSGEVESLRLLAAKGVDFKTLDAKGEGAVLTAAIFSKWDAGLFLLDKGVPDTARPDGRTAASEVGEKVKQAQENGGAIPPSLAELKKRLQSN